MFRPAMHLKTLRAGYRRITAVRKRRAQAERCVPVGYQFLCPERPLGFGAAIRRTGGIMAFYRAS